MQRSSNIQEHYCLSDIDMEHTRRSSIPENIAANEYFLKEGEISDKIACVQKGFLRAFFYDDHANEITTQFYPAGTLVISFDSFNKQVPSKENIIAHEDSELMVVTLEKQKELYKLVPTWNKICKEMAETEIQDLVTRSLQFQTMKAADRYWQFCKENPIVLQKATLGQIASYLGMDIATLSRIRKKK